MPPALKRIILKDLFTALKGRSSTTSSRSSAKNTMCDVARFAEKLLLMLKLGKDQKGTLSSLPQARAAIT